MRIREEIEKDLKRITSETGQVEGEILLDIRELLVGIFQQGDEQ